MDDVDRAYLLDRARIERALAEQARDPAARRAHIVLAEAYMLRVLNLDRVIQPPRLPKCNQMGDKA